MRSLWDDLSLVYAHEVLPDDLERELPSVTETWGDFNGGLETGSAVADTRVVKRETKRQRFVRIHQNLAQGRPGRFEEFVDGIKGGRTPRLHLIHILLPHVPFQYLPSGRFYRRTPKEALTGLDGRPGYGSPFVVEQAYQRHLLQLQATDRLLGELLDRLHEVGIYDRAVVGVVADHGMSFRLGHDRRLVRAENVQDIAPVPVLPEGAGPEARADQRPPAADGRRAAHDRGHPRRGHPVEGRRTLGARAAEAAAPRDHRQEVQAHLPGRHPGLPERQASRPGAQDPAVRRRHLRVRAAARPDRALRAGWRTHRGGGPRQRIRARPRGRHDPGRPARRRADGGGGRERPRGRHRG